MKLKIEYLPLSELKPYVNNAKLHPAEQIEQIKKSIEEFGFDDPIAIWKDSTVIEGHGRLIAASEMGLETVPVIRLDHLTDEQRRAYTLVHNKLTMNSDFSPEILTAELDNLQELDMSQFGFDIEIEDIPEQIDEAEIDEDHVEARCKLGDLWKLGDHRLICGDSTDVNVIDRLMDGQRADMVMEDPPYGINAEKMTMGTGAKEFYRGKDWDSERPDISVAFTLADNICIWGGELLHRCSADIERLACVA